MVDGGLPCILSFPINHDLGDLPEIHAFTYLYTPLYAYTLGCSLFLKSDLNFMDIKSCALFTELGRLVVESLVFYIGIYTPRPTYYRGKMIDWEVFFKVLVILHHILTSILIIYPIGLIYVPFNCTICLEIYLATIDFGVKLTNFPFTP